MHKRPGNRPIGKLPAADDGRGTSDNSHDHRPPYKSTKSLSAHIKQTAQTAHKSRHKSTTS